MAVIIILQDDDVIQPSELLSLNQTYQIECIPPLNEQIPHWPSSVTHDLRNHLVNKLTQALLTLPSINSNVGTDSPLSIASRIENDIYEQASSLPEYHDLISKEIKKFQRIRWRRRQVMQIIRRRPRIPPYKFGSLGADLVTALCTTATKDWQQTVSQRIRNYIVQKLICTILPSSNRKILLDKRREIVVAYIRQVELNFYKQANSRSEYFSLTAEKIYKIDKELEIRKMVRLCDNRHVSANSVQPMQPLHPDNDEIPTITLDD